MYWSLTYAILTIGDSYALYPGYVTTPLLTEHFPLFYWIQLQNICYSGLQ